MFQPRPLGSPDEISSPRLGTFHKLWASKRQDNALPPKSAFDPLEAPRLYPWIVIAERIEGDYRYRLVGTRVVDAYGFDFTGRLLSGFGPEPIVQETRAVYDMALDQGVCVVNRGNFGRRGRAYVRFEFLHCPVADRDGVPRFVYVAGDFQSSA